MNKGKMLWALVSAVLLLCVCAAAQADANLLENGSVQYAYVESEDALRTWIDNFGAYSVQEEIDNETQYSNIYKIVLDEPGQLVICPLARYRAGSTDDFTFSLYADFALQSEIAGTKTRTNDRQSMLLQNVDAGTYYFRIRQRDYSWLNAILTVYIGFIPVNGGMRTDTVTEEAMAKSRIEFDSVNVAWVHTVSEFAQMVDHDLAYASYDQLGQQEQSAWRQFEIEKPGRLLVLPLIQNTFESCVEIYSDATCSSKILSGKSVRSDRETILYVTVEPGVYYYRSYNSYSGNDQATYLGFIPDDGIVEDDRFAEAPARVTTPINARVLNAAAEFTDFVNGSKPTFGSTISDKSNTTVYSFTLDEGGVAYFATICSRYEGALHLYSNRSCTSRIMRMDIKDSMNACAIFLEAGTYYLRPTTSYSADISQTTYVGFVPTSKILSVANVRQDAEKAVVRFEIDDLYNPDLSRAQVRVEPGYVHARLIGSADFWKESERTNAIESHEFIATENGVYTARISGNGLPAYMLTFEVTGIGEEPEAAASEEADSYIRMLEQMMKDFGITVPDHPDDITEADYVTLLEKTLRDSGIFF